MKYFFYLFAIPFFLIHGLVSASEVVAFRPNDLIKIVDNDERRDAAVFIACLDGFKNVAEKTLDMYKEGHEKLSDREILFLKFCIEANDIVRYKVNEHSNAVYKKACSFDLSSPSTMLGLEFWPKLLCKKKVDPQLFDEQLAYVEKMKAFIEELIAKGLICHYPRTVGGKIVYKAAL